MTDRSTFYGYPRSSGRAGVRNHVLLLSINGLVAAAAHRVASAVRGVCLVATPYGRGQFGRDRDLHIQQLVGMATNPNVGAVLILGADRKTADGIASAIGSGRECPLEVVCLDDVGEDSLQLTALGIRAAARLSRYASQARREPVSVSELLVGMECGHSDATSGLAANPLVGAVADWLVDSGATAVLGETIEWLGGEDVLRERASSAEVGAAIRDSVSARQTALEFAGEDLLGNNPGQENIRGGLSTIEEKSLGAIAKSGSRPIRSLLEFATPPQSNGLHLMDGPSFSPESLSGFVAAGAQMVLFTTGPGNSFCSLLAPTIKIGGNAEAVTRMPEQIDFDASGLIQGHETMRTLLDEFLPNMLDWASGTLTWGEVLGEGSECFTRLGPSL